METQLHPKGHSPLPANFGPCLLWPNGWIDQDATWYESRPRPRLHCVTWGPISPSQKRVQRYSPQFSAHVYCFQTIAHLSYCWALVNHASSKKASQNDSDNDQQVVSSSRDRRPFGHNRHKPKIGGCVPLWELDPQSPSNTMWPGPRPTYVPSDILINPAIWPQQTWAEIWEGLCPLFFWGGGAGFPCNTMSPGPTPSFVPMHLDPSSRLATIHRPKSGGAAVPHPFWGQIQHCRLGRSLPPYQVAYWSNQPFGLNMGRKLGALCPLGRGIWVTI